MLTFELGLDLDFFHPRSAIRDPIQSLETPSDHRSGRGERTRNERRERCSALLKYVCVSDNQIYGSDLGFDLGFRICQAASMWDMQVM